MILHLLRGDRKFFGPVTKVFEGAAPGRNLYVLVGEPDEGFVMPDGALRVDDPDDLRGLLPQDRELEGIVLNGLAFATAGAHVERLPRHLPVAWYTWGFEVYDYLPALKGQLLLPQTVRAWNAVRPSAEQPGGITGWATDRFGKQTRLARRLLSRIDLCVSPIREEYELFIASGLPDTIQHQWGLVGSIEDYVDASAELMPGDDVQLGNSAYASNNHLDGFETLRAAGVGGRRVVVPLGYGIPEYRDSVVSEGRRVFGELFVPLMTFIPPVEYREIIHPCGHVVMNHLRQQALGNIFDALWRGARLYLNDTSAYRGLLREGFDVELIGTALAPGAGLEAPSAEAMVRHRALLEDRFAEARVVRATQDLLERLSAMTATRRKR
jgi:dTDP-N-acetylfucosamine:lipid II N-acetylfucosaminyltransferase